MAKRILRVLRCAAIISVALDFAPGATLTLAGRIVAIVFLVALLVDTSLRR